MKVVILFNGFSGSSSQTGLEDLAIELQNQATEENLDVNISVFEHFEQQEAFDYLQSLENVDHITVAGHSLGGDSSVEFAKDFLLPNDIKVNTLIQLDSVGLNDDIIPENVERAINYWQEATGLDLIQGEREVRAENPEVTQVFNINVEELLGLNPEDVTHTSIDDPGLIPELNDLILCRICPTPTVCFLTGTHILTDNGYRKVEELAIGDIVQTGDGKLEAIKWIGRQTFQPYQIKHPIRGYPIQIKVGALGDNIPSRDLYVSPDHALLVDGLLINAGALVNDISIVKTQPTETFVYYHVELESHTLLVAEGALAESYFPQKENRLDYDNGAEYEELYPHGSKLLLWLMDYPRVSSSVTVPRFV